MRKVPKLRFKEFSNEWEEKKLEDIGEINPKSKSIPEKFVYIDLESVVDGQLKEKKIIEKEEAPSRAKRLVEKNDILYQMVRPYQQNNLYFSFNDELDYVASTGYAQIRTFHHNNSMYVYHLIHTKKFLDKVLEKCTGTSYPAINSEDLANISIKISKNINEQEKIANFLSNMDKKISLTEEKLELFREYKKGVMQKIFSQELRFKDSEGNDYPEWEEKKLEEVFERIIERNVENNTNVLTISAQYGLISQIDFFNKTVAGKDLSKYYLLQEGDFAYNKSYSNGYPMGAIKKLKFYEKGIVSTLYICFRLKNKKYSTNYFEQYFESRKIDKNIQEIAQEGTRNHGLLNISVKDFFNIYIPFPTLEEQQKIADFLSSIDSKIENIEKELEELKEFKKGLLQQMFV